MSTISIKEPSVVIREKRLGTINAFTGSASQIVEKSAKGELHDCKRKFSQCLGCNQQQAFCQLAMIRDAVVINHAPIGCSGEFADFTYRLCVTPELVSQLLAMGEKVEVLEPEELREIINDSLKKSLERYEY